MTVRVLCGDARDVLRTLPDASVHCCVTSPPYFKLRDYHAVGQIGQEPTPAAYIAELLAVFREVKRVLRKDGICWVNVADTYAGAGRGPTGWNGIGDAVKRQGFEGGKGTHKQGPSLGRIEGYKKKDLLGIPWRFAIAMQDDGWWWRSAVAWCKRSHIPERFDRPTTAWEPVLMFTKSERYWYDAKAVREEGSAEQDEHNQRYAKVYDFDVAKPGNGVPGNVNHAGLHSRPGEGGHNMRNYWLLSQERVDEAHFATFPSTLPERCIKASCPERGTVLDPFLGSGTTGLVADRLNRDCIGIEINPQYADMARRRITGDSPMFTEVEVA